MATVRAGPAGAPKLPAPTPMASHEHDALSLASEYLFPNSGHDVVSHDIYQYRTLIRIVHHGVTIWTLPGSSSSQHVSLVGPAPSSWSTHITQHHLS